MSWTEGDEYVGLEPNFAGAGRLAGAPKPPKTNSARPRSTWRDHVLTAAELRGKTFPSVSYIVPGLIPDGLSLLCGRPKVGKSWLALDLALAVAAERYCLGDRKPAGGDVLYAALEDNERRLQRRIDKLLPSVSAEWPARLTLTTKWRRLDQGGASDLCEWIASAGSPRLVVLDTLAGVKPRSRSAQSSYEEDYQSLTELRRVANDRSIAIVIVHHTRKMEADDPVDTISGTLGLAGCADTILVLGNRSSRGTTLYVRGRDIEEAEHAISFDKRACRWTILGSAADVHRSNERGNILAVLEVAMDLMAPKEIAIAAGMDVNNVYQLLFKMSQDGEVVKIGGSRGQYRHPSRLDLEVAQPPIRSIRQ